MEMVLNLCFHTHVIWKGRAVCMLSMQAKHIKSWGQKKAEVSGFWWNHSRSGGRRHVAASLPSPPSAHRWASTKPSCWWACWGCLGQEFSQEVTQGQSLLSASHKTGQPGGFMLYHCGGIGYAEYVSIFWCRQTRCSLLTNKIFPEEF